MAIFKKKISVFILDIVKGMRKHTYILPLIGHLFLIHCIILFVNRWLYKKKKNLQLKIGSYSFGNKILSTWFHNWIPLDPKCIGSVVWKKGSTIGKLTTFPVIPVDGSYNMSFICAMFLTAVKKRHSRRSLFCFVLVWWFYHLPLLFTHLGTYSGQ